MSDHQNFTEPKMMLFHCLALDLYTISLQQFNLKNKNRKKKAENDHVGGAERLKLAAFPH